MRTNAREALVVFGATFVFGVMFAVFTPPFATPDETGHWLRAVAIATGDSWGHTPVATVPVWSRSFIDSYAPGGDVSKLSAQPRFAVPVTAEKETVQLHNVASYNATGYLPAAAGVLIARATRLSPLATFRAGRVVATLFCSVIIAIGILRAGSGRSLLGLIALCPMSVALRASYSPDALLLASAILLAGVLVSPDADEPAVWRVLLAVIPALVIVLIKPPYLPLAVLAAFACTRLPSSRRARVAMAAALLVVFAATAVSVAAAARDASSRTVFRFDAPVNAAGQMQYAAHHPWHVGAILASDLARHALRYSREAIGVLGWLDVPLPWWAYVLFSAALLAAAAYRRHDGEALPMPIVLGAILTTPFVLAFSVYVIWTPTGANYLEGFQGRYLLPILPFIATLPPLRKRTGSFVPAQIIAMLIASSVLIVALCAVVRRYAGT